MCKDLINNNSNKYGWTYGLVYMTAENQIFIFAQNSQGMFLLSIST